MPRHHTRQSIRRVMPLAIAVAAITALAAIPGKAGEARDARCSGLYAGSTGMLHGQARRQVQDLAEHHWSRASAGGSESELAEIARRAEATARRLVEARAWRELDKMLRACNGDAGRRTSAPAYSSIS